MEQNYDQQSVREREGRPHPNSYIESIQIDKLQQVLYICLLELRQGKIDLLQDLARQANLKDEAELNFQHLNKSIQKRHRLEEFNEQQAKNVKERVNRFVISSGEETRAALQANFEMKQQLEKLQREDEQVLQRLREQQRELAEVRDSNSTLEAHIQRYEDLIISDSQPLQNAEQYRQNVENLEQHLVYLEAENIRKQENKLVALELQREENHKLQELSRKIRLKRAGQKGTSFKFEDDPQIREKLEHVKSQEKTKKSIETELMSFINRGMDLAQQNDVLQEFLRVTEERKSRGIQ